MLPSVECGEQGPIITDEDGGGQAGERRGCMRRVLNIEILPANAESCEAGVHPRAHRDLDPLLVLPRLESLLGRRSPIRPLGSPRKNPRRGLERSTRRTEMTAAVAGRAWRLLILESPRPVLSLQASNSSPGVPGRSSRCEPSRSDASERPEGRELHRELTERTVVESPSVCSSGSSGVEALPKH